VFLFQLGEFRSDTLQLGRELFNVGLFFSVMTGDDEVVCTRFDRTGSWLR